MMENPEQHQQQSPWFREPSPRERKIAAALFAGFGLFFLALSWVQRGWWFAWVILALAAISLYSSAKHAWRSTR
ncbi:MAG TPA: hypothetical protein VGQ99_20245 [Tepidisphaeraceae bacterium]|jgi:fatty acid desaturase|nr:hypothetical protein [Tepidisphaeraceae bacterium]